MSTFNELLGTDNRNGQKERIKELLQIAANPEITLQIRYDGINDHVTLNLSGGDVPFDVIHHMLELASTTMRKEELSTVIQQLQTAIKGEPLVLAE